MTASAARTFHHADAGTPEPEWLLDPRWSATPSLDLAGLADRYGDVLVAAAHPDDETLAVGGLVAALARLGATVTVLVATDGEASHPGARAWAPEMLARIRADEVAAAVAHLAPDAVLERLGLPDGTLTAVEERLVDSLAERCGPDTLVIAPWSADGHPDHDALGRAASGAAARSGATVAHYPVWLWHWGRPEELPWEAVHAVELTPPDLARRAAAVDEYPSQTAPLGPGPGEAAVVTEPVLRRARRVVEVLLAAPGTLPLLAPRDDADVAAPFDAMYAGGADPWGFEGSFYEERKRALTTAVLGRPRYGSVVEIGCADGLLTSTLAARAGEVVAVDVSPAALDLARARSLGNVRWVLGRAPAAVPPGPTDLVVLSEVGYFLTPLELLETLRRVRDSLTEGGEVALVHWRHPTADVPLDGPAVHDQAASVLADLPHRVHHVDADVLIDVWGHPASVAEQEGGR